MPDIDTVCDALADAVRGIEGLKAKGYPDDKVTPPEAQVTTRPFDPRYVFDTTPSQYQLTLRVFVKADDSRTRAATLRKFMEPTGQTSIRAAVETDTNWPAGVHSVEVTNIGQPGLVELGEAVYGFVDFEIDAIW